MKRFRNCLGKFATGVTVVSCTDLNGDPCGITANSFSSVSLDPPLVLWNIAKVSKSLDAYLQAELFAINVLTAGQRALSARFARSEKTLFDGVEYELSSQGVPQLPDTLATILCRTEQIHDCGDHHIIIGEVIEFSARDGEPLLYFDGDYAAVQTPGPG